MVDDEPALLAAIGRALESDGYRVRLVASAEEAIDQLAAALPDAMVLDVLLPRLSGLDLCRQLRARGQRLPILMLTARDAVPHRVAGLDAGADDYLVKPFDVEELLARLRALMRRIAPEAEHGQLRVGPLVLDLGQRRVRWADGDDIDLTHTESALLAVLMRNAGHVVSRSALFEHAWGYDYGPEGGTLSVYVGYVRRKLAACGADPQLLRNVRGLGYSLDRP
nr:response regulator transcription factor [Patulibacter medicamentivorans]